MQIQQPKSIAACTLQVGDYIVGPTLNDTVRIVRADEDYRRSSGRVCIFIFHPGGQKFEVDPYLHVPLVISAAEIAKQQRIALGLQKD